MIASATQQSSSLIICDILEGELPSIDTITRQYFSDGKSGAVASFAGITRDNFQGKRVTYLAYECYKTMALKQMNLICTELETKYASLTGLIVYHRIGEVPAGESSVLIVSASPHRAHALSACGDCIDLIKTRVPIWKKEFYEGEDAKWKQNAEYADLL